MRSREARHRLNPSSSARTAPARPRDRAAITTSSTYPRQLSPQKARSLRCFRSRDDDPRRSSSLGVLILSLRRHGHVARFAAITGVGRPTTDLSVKPIRIIRPFRPARDDSLAGSCAAPTEALGHSARRNRAGGARHGTSSSRSVPDGTPAEGVDEHRDSSDPSEAPYTPAHLSPVTRSSLPNGSWSTLRSVKSVRELIAPPLAARQSLRLRGNAPHASRARYSHLLVSA